MKIKNQKGFTGIDLVVAITIILIAVGTITMVYVSINKTYREANRTSVAGKIATDIMTAIDVSYYFEIQETVDASGNDLPIIVSGNYNNNETAWEPLVKCIGSGARNLVIPNGYTVELSVSKAKDDEIEKRELLKKIEFKITFLVSGEEKTLEFATYKGRYGATIPDKPFTAFSEDPYYETDKYEYTAVRYNRVSNVWETTVFGDNTWYEFGEGLWPVMVRMEKSKNANPLKEGKINFGSGAEVFVWFPNIVYNPDKDRNQLCATITDKTNIEKYYLFDRVEIDDVITTDDGVENVKCQYDEINYNREMSTPSVADGWYKITIDYLTNSIDAEGIHVNAGDNESIEGYYTYLPAADSDSLVNGLVMKEDVFVYDSIDNKIKNMVNFPY